MAIGVSQRSAIGSSALANARHFQVSPRFVLDGAMNRASFDAYVEHQRAPALKPGQILAARP